MRIRTEAEFRRVGMAPITAAAMASVIGLLHIGCAPPQVDPGNRELVLRLATATSTRDSALLEEAAVELERLRGEGGLSGWEASAFDAIIEESRAGDWNRARDRAYALRDAQKPTEADLERLRSRPLPRIKTPGRTPPGS